MDYVLIITVSLISIWYSLCGLAVANLIENEKMVFDKDSFKFIDILFWPILLAMSILIKNNKKS